MFFAHSKGENRADWQSLKCHLENTAQIARSLSTDTHFENLAYIAALLHDIGKYSIAFQNRLLGDPKSVDHSTAGAQLINKMAGEDKLKQFVAHLIGFCIAGHHSGLPDYGSRIDHYTEPTLLARLKRKVDDYSNYSDDFSDLNISFPTDFQIKPTRKNGQFSISFLVRMIYSTLVDSDFLETESFLKEDISRGKHLSIIELKQQLGFFLKKFENPVSDLNIKRSELLFECVEQAEGPQGLFSMTIPTGGGKTLTSLAFSLAHAKQHDLKRVIYCIPYTSIIEQTAKVFRDALNGDCVLEHHSNFDWQGFHNRNELISEDDLSNTALKKLKLASENWDIPIIVTTNVQFFESLFSNRSSRVRKLHSLIKSVIVFDEAQMLPRDYLEPCMISLAELIANYQASVVFCTATQPPLSQFFPDFIQPTELIKSPTKIYNFFKRVKVKNINQKTDMQIAGLLNENQQSLCIVNTRKHAKGLFEYVTENNRYHLSTLMCPAHRSKTIEKIHSDLRNGKPCRVVSTQIMEAGIDVDFPVGFRALAGLDSIVQAAGRINRENKFESGVFYVFEPESELIKHVPAFIRQTASVARIILDQYEDPISIEALNAYYQLLYGVQAEDAFDKKGILAHFEKNILDEPNFDFRTASEKFKLIENDQVSVIIPWNESANEGIEKLRFSEYPLSSLRSLQPFIVNIYPHEFNALLGIGMIDLVHDHYAILNNLDEEVYHPDTGLVIPQGATGDAYFS